MATVALPLTRHSRSKDRAYVGTGVAGGVVEARETCDWPKYIPARWPEPISFCTKQRASAVNRIVDDPALWSLLPKEQDIAPVGGDIEQARIPNDCGDSCRGIVLEPEAPATMN